MTNFIRASILCLPLLAVASQAAAQVSTESVGTASVDDFAVHDDFSGAYTFGNDGGSYLLFQKMVGDGTGYTASFQRLGLRAKLIDTGDSHLWGSTYLIITDENRLGFNVGGGYRWIIDGNIVGFNGWYDNFQTDLNNTYQQTTFGVELLHDEFDFRANVYIPFGDTENFVGIAGAGTVPIFNANQIVFLGSAFEEQAMEGFDAEVGVPLFQIPWARAYAGGYFYSSESGEDAPGARGRIETAISDDLSLNFMVSNDPVFDTNYNLGIEYRFSGGIAPPTTCPFHGWNRKYAQVRRQWPIATRVTMGPALVDSINPRTGLPNNVIHVDNTNPNPGDGTFENPFQMLPDAAPGADMILVYSGMGSTVGNITLSPFQRLLGEGKPYFFQDVVRGDVLLPESFARTGPAPTLVPVNPANNLITIASGTEVNNFTLLADGTTAIGGMNVTDFGIGMIGGRAENGIRIVNASGSGVINGFGMPGDPFLVTDTGIFVNNTSGSPLRLDVDNVHTAGGEVGIEIAAMGGVVNTDIDTFRGDNHTDAGLILSAIGGISTHVAEVDNAVVLSTMGATGHGFVLDVSGGGTLAAVMNTVRAAGNDDLFSVNVATGQLNATINDSIFNESVTGNGIGFTLQNARGRTTFNNLMARRNAMDGLNAVASGIATNYTIEVIDSDVAENGDDNFDTSVSGGAVLRLFVDPTLATGSMTGSGFEFDVRDPGSVLIADIIETNLSMSALHAVDGNVVNGGVANLSLVDSLGILSGDDGLHLNVDTGGTLIGTLLGGSFSRSGGDGVDVSVAGSSSATLSFDGTPVDMNAQNGVLVTVDGPGSQMRLSLAGSTVQGNMGDGIDAMLTGGGPGSLLNVDLTSTSVSMNAGNGLDLSLTGASATSRVNLVDALLNDNLGDGFEFDVTDRAELIAVASGAGRFNRNAGRAWHGTISDDGSAAALNFSGSTADFSGLEGGLFDVTAGGLFNLTMFDVNVTGSQVDGIRTNVTGMGSEANFRLDTVRLRNNGQFGFGDAFEVVAADSSLVQADLNNMLVRANRDNGFRFDLSTDAIVSTRIMQSVSDGNGRSGMSFDVVTGGRFAAAVTGGSFSNDGLSFAASGVEGVLRGVGSTATVLFDGTSVDGNTRHGFDLYVDTGARLFARLNTTGSNGTLSASDNALSGVRFLALDGGPTSGNILMSGGNEFNDNRAFGVDIDGMDIAQMIAGFSGSAMGNADDGVNIRIDNVALGAVAISGDDGVVSGNVGDGVEVTVLDTDLGPAPFGADIIPALTIDGVASSNNFGHGIVVTGVNTDFTDGVLTENIASNNQGDGLVVMLTDSLADNLQVVRNDASDNMANGINIELLRTPIDNLQIEENGTLGTGMTNLGLTFFVEDDTLSNPFDITNTSDPGIDVTGFRFDMSTSVTGAIFNTVSGAATPFTPLAGTDVSTGLTAVNGTPVPPYPPNVVPDFSQLLALEFDDFQSNETFIWSIDADFTPGGQEIVFGNDLIGSTVVVDFSNGAQLTGALMAVPGNPDASLFVATSSSGVPGAVANNGLHGIRLVADDSPLSNLSIQDSVAMNNAASGLLLEMSNGSHVTTATLDGNAFSMNAGGGMVLDFDDSSLTDATINDGSVTGNTGDGILFDFQNSPVANLTIQDNPDIDQNTGNGINFQMVNSSINNLLIDNNGMGGVIPPPPAGAFDIQVNLAPGLTPTQIAAFQAAEQRWEEIIIGDLPDIGMIDDVLIDASAMPIDGPGGILGQAGPTGVRAGSFLPFQGVMEFDTADLAALETAGQLDEVILHEMAHVLGFGTLWDNLGLLLNPSAMGGMDPRFTGPLATAEYNARFGTMDPDVPVEAMGGPGTADLHWRESVFTNELMTGFLDSGVANPISRTTVAQFDDLGYVVDLTQSDPFVVSPPGPPGPSIEGDFNHDFEETVVDLADAMSSGLPALQIGNNGYAALQAIQQNGLNGINISLTNSDLTGAVISNNSIAGHSGGDGVRMLNPTTTGTPIELDFDGNTMSSNFGGRGVNIALAQPDLDSSFTNNEISGNGSQGVNLALAGGVTADVDFVGNTFSLNGSEGVNVTAAGTSTFNNLDFSGNTVGSNGGIGLHVSGTDNATVALNLGATGAMNGLNDFVGNEDAGVAVELSGNAMGTLDMTQTLLRNTINGALPDFTGDGLHVRIDGNSMLTADIDGDLLTPPVPGTLGAPATSTVAMTGNAGDGATFHVGGNANLSTVFLVNTVVSGNLGDGLDFTREGTGNVNMVTVANNDITANAGDGVSLNASNALLVDDYFIAQNLIQGNTGNGVHLFTEADAQILADVEFNLINANQANGILAEGRENDPTDVEAVAGDWLGNTISNSGQQGINLLAEHGTFAALNIGMDGVDGVGRSLGNVINGNALDGIQIGGNDQMAFAGAGGAVSIVNNMITGNGTLGTAEDNHGIDINTPGGSEVAIINNNTITGHSGNGMQLSNRGELLGPGTNVLTVSADNNTITGNAADGVEILTSGNDDGLDGRQRTDIDITNSTISGNGAHGLEVLNRGDGDAFNRARVSVANTVFDTNVSEAVYVVNTADIAQTLDTLALTAGGNVFNDPVLRFDFTSNTVTNSGSGSAFSGTGLVVRVGSSGATTAHTDAGGFASDGAGNLTGRGGVLGTVTDNTFGGNFGVDVLFESFTSTVDPTSGTTWDAMNFDPTGYQTDPLARFDVVFTGNTGDAVDVTRPGAFYANADPLFKSRDTAQAPAGPFVVGGARRRNAQRLASRGLNAFGAFAAPLASPDAGAFLYPGTSTISTFRASVASTTADFGIGDTFFTLGDFVAFPGAGFGETVFGWSSF